MIRRIVPLAALLVAVAGCQAVDQVNHMFGDSNRPTVAIKDTHVVSMTEDHVNLRFDVELTNRYDSALPVWGIKYTMLSQGEQLSSGELHLDSALMPRSTRVVPIDVQLSFADLASKLPGKGPGSEIAYATNIDVAVDGKDGAMSLPTLKFVSKITLPGMGPSMPKETASAQ